MQVGLLQVLFGRTVFLSLIWLVSTTRNIGTILLDSLETETLAGKGFQICWWSSNVRSQLSSLGENWQENSEGDRWFANESEQQ
ncbi:hypothetical protein BKA67DRAFT_124661 [Truncatella angustata]|uniref:Uncharacterized protein n=1 Tax=Truncatella angustata TaxID=152316 RepID=A0A9P8RF82_9PEZI|nr:uncharacterized protein BKA67DRAFT_124661 [Truncatella angustata]KAH6644913.1 hypothetical protein BKA67DRAFT_124661 [Truncatella angustata]